MMCNKNQNISIFINLYIYTNIWLVVKGKLCRLIYLIVHFLIKCYVQ